MITLIDEITVEYRIDFAAVEFYTGICCCRLTMQNSGKKITCTIPLYGYCKAGMFLHGW
jgi:hypothetical protein